MNWGIIGYGTFAPKFIKSLLAVPGQRLYAIASTSNYEKAAIDMPNVKIYNSYRDLVDDRNVDIIYICSTHNFHFEHAKLALDAGKHVLCEKPLTPNWDQTVSLCKIAGDKGLFLMEGLWTRFLPAYRAMRDVVKNQKIGFIKYISTHFSFLNSWPPERRILNKSLAGGATYDVGIYNLSLICDLLGYHPSNIVARAHLSSGGVDESCAVLLEYEDGRLGYSYCGIKLFTAHNAGIAGTDGFISMDPHWKPESFVLNIEGESIKEFSLPFISTGYYHEIEEVVSCIKQGLLESPTMPLTDSIALSSIMQKILIQINYF
ncbi:MAG TPA: Gfo/Idh/MocA family oxidoreductase [Saprospiraceae bacterium]|nr:Gfo/Idh/MocA family oxidoreductase [Saprospiraceae bacterium]